MTRKPTDNLHDYINILYTMSDTVERQTIAAVDAYFSDMKGEVIKSFPDQVAEQIRFINEQAKAVLAQQDNEMIEEDVEEY
ncbi:MAG TPA: hypothetical protein P5035_01155 [Bacteroidales bacterium]|nr:hypothetical protein [Rectinema sp.]HRU33991.1 hypothetical protein [Bacteroidales bacterium]